VFDKYTCRVPDRIIGKPPKNVGPTAGVTVDEETLYKEYLAAMNWDTATGKPTKRRLLELGLGNAAGELYP
jgi:aldehyde:ferredoxin oxidoreductase